MLVETTTRREVAGTLLNRHYAGRLPPTSYAFRAEVEGGTAVATIGVPASHHLRKGVCPADPSCVLELNRVWTPDDAPHGTGSAFIAAVLKLLPPMLLVSYADTAQGHYGYQYRAANFFYAGWTDMDRKTPRFDYVVEGKHSRDAFRGEPGRFTRVRRKPKVRYWTATGDRRERRRLAEQCAWPKLCWKTLPPETAPC